MAKLLDQEWSGHRVNRFWRTRGDRGRSAITVETVEDAEPIIRANRREFNDAPKTTKAGGFRKVASIPFTVLEDFAKLKQIPFREFIQNKTDRAEKAWDELLNDRNFRSFRTHPGRV